MNLFEITSWILTVIGIIVSLSVMLIFLALVVALIGEEGRCSQEERKE